MTTTMFSILFPCYYFSAHTHTNTQLTDQKGKTKIIIKANLTWHDGKALNTKKNKKEEEEYNKRDYN